MKKLKNKELIQGFGHILYYNHEFHGHIITIDDSDPDTFYFHGIKSLKPPEIHDCMAKDFYSESGFYDIKFTYKQESIEFLNILYSGQDWIQLSSEYDHVCHQKHDSHSHFLFTTTAIITDESKASQHVEKYFGIPYSNDMIVCMGVMEWLHDDQDKNEE